LKIEYDSVEYSMPVALVLSLEVDLLSGGGVVTGSLQVLLCALSPGSSTTRGR